MASLRDVYIQIPLPVMSRNESISIQNQLSSHEDESPYKLIEGFHSCADIRKRKSYVMSYNKETKNADWVYEILNESTLKERYKENISFGKNELEDKNYQQGHLAAAANHRWCQEAYHDTYLLTNMIPQLSDSNQGVWKTFEEHCRDLAKPGCNVHVYSGPLYLRKRDDQYVRVENPTNPKNNEEKANSEKKNSEKKNSKETNPKYEKVVPSHLFKVIIVEKEGRVEEPKCYKIPNEQPEYDIKKKSAENFSGNDKTPKLDLEEFQENDIETIEIWSGLKFKIDKPQHNMKKQTKTIIWKGEDKEGELCEAKIEVKIQI